jgi:hypothetical protein
LFNTPNGKMADFCGFPGGGFGKRGEASGGRSGVDRWGFPAVNPGNRALSPHFPALSLHFSCGFRPPFGGENVGNEPKMTKDS